MNNRLLQLVACPICQGQLKYDEQRNQLICEQDQMAYSIYKGIPVLLSEQGISLSEQASEAK